MATLTWNGDIADWNTEADWTPNTSGNDVPKPGDTAIIDSGTVILTTDAATQDQLFENNLVMLGGALGATLLLGNSQPSGRFYNISIGGTATIEANGKRGFAGSINGQLNQASVTLKADPGGELVLLHGGSLNLNLSRPIDLEGNITLERSATFTGDIVNNGTLSILSGTTSFVTNSLSGTGTIAIGGYGKLNFSGGGANQTVSFSGLGGTLGLDYQDFPGYSQSPVSATFRDFAPGDFIEFLGADGSATSASLDTAAHTLTISSGSGVNYVINNFYGQAGTLSDVSQSNGRDLISYASAAPRLDYQIDAGARAMHADVAHQMTAPGTGAPITGTGIKIGIISDSYNRNGGAAADVAAGYLPASGVTVLREGPSGGEDEGRAMAELIHQSAPGASLYFSSANSGVNDFAASISELQAAGCTVIVDDIGYTGFEPFFQLGSPTDTAISNAIAHGVTYVSAQGNFGDPVYQHAFATTAQTLADGSNVQAMTFSNGTPYQSITAAGRSYDYIDLQWDQPFYGTGGVATDQPCCVSMKLFNADTNALVASSFQVRVDGHLVADSELAIPRRTSDTTYNLAIYQNAGTPAVSQIKYILQGYDGGSGGGGTINDPDAGVGSGAVEGHNLVPGEISVAAMDVTNTSAFGRTPDFAEYFTSTGPGTLLFDENGNRLAQPITVGSPDVTGPDGVRMSVAGFSTFYGTSAAAPNVAAVAALLQQVRPGISPASVATILAQSAIPLSNSSTDMTGAGLVQADRAILLAEEMACYAEGTRIMTDRGERPVETLAIGDLVVTASGEARPIKWLCHRTLDCRRHPDRALVLPIRIAAHALGKNRPARELFVSPGHAICVDVCGEVLIPACALVNGATIVQVDVEDVTYWHVELDSHDVILAENLPSESYLDMGNRGFFREADVIDLAAGPDALAPTHAEFCRPFHADGDLVAFLHKRLVSRAQALGWSLRETPLGGLHLIVDGVRIEPEIRDLSARFLVPADAGTVWLQSVSVVPAHIGLSDDVRTLGVLVSGVTIEYAFGAQRAITPDDPRLRLGFHAVEPGPRAWTAGRALLPRELWEGVSGAFFLRVDLGMAALPHWVAPAGDGTTVMRAA